MNYEQIVIDYYTILDNNKRNNAKSQIIEKINKAEDIEQLTFLLTHSHNQYVLAYACSILSEAMLNNSKLFIGKSLFFQTIALQLYSSASLNDRAIKNLASKFFASCVIGCWQIEHNTQNLVNTLTELESKKYSLFADIALTLIETFRSYQDKPNFPKKIIADFRNGVLMVIAKLAIKNIQIKNPGAVDILESVMFVCNVTKTDETDETSTFCPTPEFHKLFMESLDSIIQQIPTTLPLIDRMSCIQSSCFYDSDNFEGSREWFVQKIMKVVEFCFYPSNNISLLSIGAKILVHLHTTHPLHNYVTQEFIDKIAQCTVLIACNGNDNALYDILRFWGIYSLYSSIDPSSTDCLTSIFCRLVLSDNSNSLTSEEGSHFGTFARNGLTVLISMYDVLLTYLTTDSVTIPTSQISFIQKLYNAIQQAKTDRVNYFGILSNLFLIAGNIISGRDPTSPTFVSVYSGFASKICTICKLVTEQIIQSTFDKNEEDSAYVKLQISILTFYKAYIVSSLWDDSKNYRFDGMLVLYQSPSQNGIEFFIDMVGILFTLIPYWNGNYKVLSETMKLLAKLLSAKEYALRLIERPPLKYLFQTNAFTTIDNIQLKNAKELIEIRTLYFTALGMLLYSLPSKFHLQFLTQFLNPHTYQLIDIRAIVKTSHSSVECIPPIFEHICAHKDIYLALPNEPVNGDNWYFSLKLIKQISMARDFRYNYAPECPTACILFHSMSGLLTMFSQTSIQQSSMIMRNTKTVEFDAFIKNATVGLATSVWMLQNSHINFAAFKLYNDNTVSLLINSMCEFAMMLENVVEVYPKTKEILFAFVETISKQVTSLQLESNKVLFIIKCAIIALKQKKVSSIVMGSSTIENMLFDSFKKRTKNSYCAQLLNAVEPLIGDILFNVFDNLFNEFEAWTLEKLVFGIMVIYPEVYTQTQYRIAMEIHESKNREKFLSFFQSITLSNISDLDVIQKIDFDSRLRSFVAEIKPLYHNNCFE
ncbi:hypothetical protein KM1_097020 [Entamoeba histolytica HM-3:IMSS]|uniref:Uncharacterized protein n=1 Tax=Entamoeba histolytica HM-3:IMSS TaxID=885315 RepID=M7WN08_ENTHI|nr:hypothetical protein KM1_097020 [Entamoeba histolytica HM-3:IMSS]